MPLRNSILTSPETFSDLLLAADDRYQEAEYLLEHQCFDGCVYLLGYAAEMWLKAVCMRLRNLSPTDLVKSALPPLKTWMRSVAPHVLFSSYHDLAFFAECAMQLRLTQGRPLDLSVSGELQSHVISGLHQEWIVDVRYRRSGVNLLGAWQALENAWWIKTNWTSLI